MKTCPVCEEPFTARTSRQIYCSEDCKYEAKNALRAGVDNADKMAMTLEETAAELGVSKTRVGQLEERALKKLRGLQLRREDWL
ncbi:MAG TPA: sigma factor-like helix-turn-helix DNA-binding protein [Polyangiaceae bacterium]|jgi:imidazolonepropionase-like amidohydrolase|nr:sigma factor-like helix-turn-helix DNA-binding protein [Polyangiaceae bacterium]